MKKRTKITLVFIGLWFVYLAFGYLLHLVIFPEKIPNISTYFHSGDVFKSDFEGFTQIVTRQKDGKVYCKLVLEAYAAGPPMHVHTSFDELFENGDDTMSIIIDNDTVTLQPYENRLILKGTPHKPFNPSAHKVHLSMKEFAFPEKFAFYLNQVYGFIDESKENLQPPKVLFQMAMFNQYFDSYVTTNAPPVPVQSLPIS